MLEQKISNISERNKGYRQEKITVVYCTDVGELFRRVESIQKTEALLYRWGCDHGQGLIKLLVQPTYGISFLGSVKDSMLVAVSDAPAIPHNLNKYFNLFQN